MVMDTLPSIEFFSRVGAGGVRRRTFIFRTSTFTPFFLLIGRRVALHLTQMSCRQAYTSQWKFLIRGMELNNDTEILVPPQIFRCMG